MIGMKIKFNMYERVAGLFVLGAIVGGVVSLAGVAIKKGWFETKVHFETTLETADGVRAGTQVQMAGLRAGSVTSVELKSNNEVHVKFEISEKFRDRVHQDSVVRVTRPFIIGEKVLDLSVGSEATPLLAENSVLRAEKTADIMDLVSGRTLGPYIETMGQMMENLKFVAEAFLDPERSKAIVKIFDEMTPLVKNMSGMSREATSLLKEVNHKKKLVHALDNLVVMTDELNRVLPALTKDSPELAKDLAKIAKNTAVLTDELQKALPAIQEIGPELPHASRRALEALDETVVTLKALQKSFLLRGNVADVREEEAAEAKKEAQKENRQPANASTPHAEKKGE